MDSFLIGGTEFGIDRTQSVLRLEALDSGARVLTFDVNGDVEIHQAISEPEDSEWNWTVYPPWFYLHAYELPPGEPNEHSRITLAPDDYDKYEVALYMMVHNDVSDIVIELYGGSLVSVFGVVDLMGKKQPFQIQFSDGARSR